MPTTRRNQTGNTAPVQKIPPNKAPAPSAGGGGGGGGSGPVNRPTAAPVGPAPLIGEPEFLPQHIFVAEAAPGGDNGFIAAALQFHRNINPDTRPVSSVEQIVELLADKTKTGEGLLDRIRIVAHFLRDDHGAHPSVMGIKFLTDGARGAFGKFFDGFARSSEAGLRSIITISEQNKDHLSVFDDSADNLILALRDGADASLKTALDAVYTSQFVMGDRGEFATLHAAKWGLKHQTPAPTSNASLKASLEEAYDLILAAIRKRLTVAPENVAPAHLDAIANAIAARTEITGVHFLRIQTTPPGPFANYVTNVAAGVAAAKNDTFRNKLIKARERFDRFTTIDVRGCQVGADTDYMKAIQSFFGRTGTVRPVVTGPRIFQLFSPIGLRSVTAPTPQAAVTQINVMHTAGLARRVQGTATFPAWTRDEVRGAHQKWAAAFGITPAHLTFWQTTFGLSALAFSTLGWRASLPARKVPISRLDTLPGLAFTALFNRLGEIFFIRDDQRPSATDLGRISPHLADIGTWIGQLDAALTSANQAAQFAHYTTIYTAVDRRMATTSFQNGPNRIVPATMPATLAGVQAVQAALKTFIQTHDQSIFAPVRRFLTAAKAAADADHAALRYFLGLGLVFQLTDIISPDLGRQAIVYCDDAANDGREHEAIRHWVRAMWRGQASPVIPAGMTPEQGRHSARFVQNHEPLRGPSFVCPDKSYSDRIETVPA